MKNLPISLAGWEFYRPYDGGVYGHLKCEAFTRSSSIITTALFRLVPYQKCSCLFVYIFFNTCVFFRTDPVRPFISGHVANSMAAEVIALLHSLLMAPESNAAQIWTTTAEKVKEIVLTY